MEFSEIKTIPNSMSIMKRVSNVPTHMWPNLIPHAVVQEDALTIGECDHIIYEMEKLEAYTFPGCNAVTREPNLPLHQSLNPIVRFGLNVNLQYFHFDIGNSPGAWFQTYEEGNDYHIHADASLGQTRKLTVVALLSPPEQYDGGILRIIPWPEYAEIPRTRGTMIAFPSWMLHEVSKVIRGKRQTINLGFWGPPWQ